MSEEKKVGPCDFNAGDPTWCQAMDRMLEDEANSHKKGFSIFVLTNMETLKERVAGVVYRKGPKDKGVLLHVCPFCTKNINWFNEPGEGDSG